jgi:predicted DNA-binding transcriptional regulator YafY
MAWKSGFKVIPNYELESLLLSFGENVKVLRPEWLAGKLAERIEKMKGVYSDFDKADISLF